MYRNLEAEQHRYGYTNADMAAKLGVCLKTYTNKKQRGTFTLSEAKTLLALFGCEFDYLFATDIPA